LNIFRKSVDNIPERPAFEKTLFGVINYRMETRYGRRRRRRRRRRRKRDMRLK